MGKRSGSDETHKLEDLRPFDVFPFAVGFVNRIRLYQATFRRYRTLADAKAAKSALAAAKPSVLNAVIYEFNFDTDTWEAYYDEAQ